MSKLVELLGPKLLSKAGEVDTAGALAGKQAIALYFSAHWCPPCRGFTPRFAGWYTEHLQAKGLEVVFVSSDHDDASFKEYFGEMPWLALPREDEERKRALSKRFRVSGIPTVVVLDSDGATITLDGRSAISNDPQGEEFPWKPKSLKELLSGAKYLGQGGTEHGGEVLEGKVVGFYFSAHWCPPCRGFTPKLAEWYSADLKAKGLEVVFVSSDRDEEAFASYFAEMPWLALDFANRKLKEQLSNKFGVEGIPTLVIVDKDGSVVTTEGRAAISCDPKGADFPWYPKPVLDLAQGPGMINEVPTVLAFCETISAEAQAAAEAAMASVAQKYIDEQKAAGPDEPVKYSFMIAKASGGLSARLRKMFSLPHLPPSKHEHAMAKHEGGGGWGCDGCGKGGADERYRCQEGCDFDFCGECMATAGAPAEAAPRLFLVNVSDEGAYYEGPQGEVTAEAVRKLVADFEAGSLERKSLG